MPKKKKAELSFTADEAATLCAALHLWSTLAALTVIHPHNLVDNENIPIYRLADVNRLHRKVQSFAEMA